MTAIDPTSTFPTSVDTFPTIAQTDDEAAAGKEHWLLHNKQSNAVRAAQTRILSLISQGLASQWRNGTGAPSNGLGVDGDYYVNNTNGDVYFRASGTYSIVINLKGPQGIQGIQGPTGAVWRNGVGAPSNGLGVDGDFYLNSTTGAGAGDVYKRASGTYSVVANIKGATTIPTGGTTGQLVAKASNADFDITFVNAAALSNATPLPAGAASAGSSVAASRSDHSHPPQSVSLFDLYEPPGTLAKTFPRIGMDGIAHSVMTTGNHWIWAVPIPAGTTITTLNFQVFAAAVSPTHMWASLLDPTKVALAFTADHTTTVYGAGTTMSLNLSAPVTTGGTDALYFVGMAGVASTMPTFYGRTTGPTTVLPLLNGNIDTGMTGVPSLPYDKSSTPLSPGGGTPYIWLT